jgi:hypothetical protein
MEPDWEIKATGRDVIGGDQSSIVLEWTLNRNPDPEWLQFLIASGVSKAGSMTFISHDPKLLGNRLRMVMEDRDLEAAVRWVEQSIPIANQKFELQVLAKRRREDEQRQQQEAAKDARLQEARTRLNRLGSSD